MVKCKYGTQDLALRRRPMKLRFLVQFFGGKSTRKERPVFFKVSWLGSKILCIKKPLIRIWDKNCFVRQVFVKNIYKSSVLDHVYSTDCASISNIKSLKPVLWDQLLIHFDINIPKSEAIQSLRWDYRKYSKESLSGMLSEITWRTGVERFSIIVIFLKICGDTKIIFILYTKWIIFSLIICWLLVLLFILLLEQQWFCLSIICLLIWRWSIKNLLNWTEILKYIFYTIFNYNYMLNEPVKYCSL